MNLDGKYDGKYPIFSDILSFMWFKMRLCPRDTLLDVIKNFYKETDIIKSRDLLYKTVPDNEVRRVRHKKAEDALAAMYAIMQNIPTEDPPVFVVVNLNNIPCVDLSKIDGASLVSEQSRVKRQLEDVLQEHSAMKEQLAEILERLDRGGASSSPPTHMYNDVACMDHPRTNHGRTSHATEQRNLSRPPAQPQRGQHHVHEGAGSYHQGHGDQVPRDIIPDEEGFKFPPRRRRGPRPTAAAAQRVERHPTGGQNATRRAVTGRKTGTALKAVPLRRRIFVSRLDPEMTCEGMKDYVRELIGVDCDVERVKPKFPSYSSFVITVSKTHEDALLDPDAWEEGLIIRPFYGKITPTEDSATIASA